MVLPLFCLAFVPGVAFKDILYALVAGLVLVSNAARIGWSRDCRRRRRTRAYCFLRLFSVSNGAKTLTSPEILPYGLPLLQNCRRTKAVVPIDKTGSFSDVVPRDCPLSQLPSDLLRRGQKEWRIRKEIFSLEKKPHAIISCARRLLVTTPTPS